MEIKVILEKQQEGGYTVHVPSLPDCISEGDTKQEALKNIKEAIRLYLDEDKDDVVSWYGELVNIAILNCQRFPGLKL